MNYDSCCALFGKKLEANRGERGPITSGFTLEYYQELFVNPRQSIFYVPPAEAARRAPQHRLSRLAAHGRRDRRLPAGADLGRHVYRVQKFVEKPTLPLARRYVRSRRYLWNGGMFVWRAQTLVENFERFQPDMAKSFETIARAGGVKAQRIFARVYPRLEKISIDYALMEKISQVYVVPADIGWSDVGSWAVAYDLMDKDEESNVRPERSLAFGAKGNLIVSPKKFVAAVGVQDLVIIETRDSLLVCRRERSQDVGKAVQELEKRRLDDLL